MNTIKILIQKYWSKTATDAEISELVSLLQIEKDSLKSFLEKKYQEDILHQKSAQLSKERAFEVKKRILQSIENIEENKNSFSVPKKHYAWWMWSAAAVLAIVVCIFWANYSTNNTLHSISKNSLIASEVSRKVRILYNNSKKAWNVSLPDGSLVSMQPECKVTYPEPFVSNSREITLVGEARFDVAKNAQCPFNVTANGVITTAIGTKFIINTQTKGQVSVNLLQGKVLVHTSKGHSIHIKDTYLLPGQKLNVNIIDGNVAIQEIKKPLRVAVSKNVISNKEDSLSHAPEYNENLVFKNKPLDEVFSQISKHYSISIIFNKKELEGLTFTGHIRSTDDRQKIIKAICTINDLNIQEHTGKIYISK